MGMSESNQVISELLDLCRAKGVCHIRNGNFEASFFPPSPEPMSLDPKNLAKVLTDSMPPDSAMLFASTEGVTLENEEPTSQQRDSANMP